MQALAIQTEQDRIRALIYKACNSNGVPELANKITFSFHKNMTRVFGLAYTLRLHIKFSIPLWERAEEHQRDDVIVHEACHIVAVRKYGHRIGAHGTQWKKCMINAGHEPTRCHSIDRTGLKKQYTKHEAACSCTFVWISHVRAAYVRKRKLRCSRCKATIILTGKTLKPNEAESA